MREDWTKCRLGDILSLKNGYAFKSSKYQNEGIPIIRISDINQGIVKSQNAKRINESDEYDDYQVVHGDILIAMSGATTGKFGIYRSTEKTYQNQRVGNLRLHSEENCNKHLVYYLLYSLRQRIEKDAYGGAQPNISGKKIEAIELKLAPLPEQRAIVAKIEQLFSELDNGITNLKAAKAKLVIYRQAVLKKAFEGKLSGLGCNGLKDERIIEKETKEEILQSKNPKDPDNEGSNLPKGWKWVKLGDIAEMCLGKMLDKAKNTGEFRPYLGNINVRWGAFDLTNLKSMRFEKSEEERYEIKWGDLVVCEGGEPGRCAVWTKSFPINIQKALHRVRFQTNHHPFYFHYYFNFIAAVGKLEKHFTGTTIKHLTGRKLREINISIPSSFKAQIQIVQEIETRLSVCDNILRNIEEGLEKAEALRQSILKKAFEGKLLNEMELAACRQQPDWEPAEKLLARIRRDAMHRVSTTKRAPTHERRPHKPNKNQLK